MDQDCPLEGITPRQLLLRCHSCHRTNWIHVECGIEIGFYVIQATESTWIPSSPIICDECYAAIF